MADLRNAQSARHILGLAMLIVPFVIGFGFFLYTCGFVALMQCLGVGVIGGGYAMLAGWLLRTKEEP